MKDEHNKAAEHHESAAKSHRAAADSHGKRARNIPRRLSSIHKMLAIARRPRTRRASNRSKVPHGKPTRCARLPALKQFQTFSPSPKALYSSPHPPLRLANFERVIRTFASNRPVGSSALLVSM
jgi:hypothetical protein